MVIAQNATVEISILGAGALKAPKGKDFPTHQHYEWEVVYYRAGFIDCPVGNEVFKSRPGLVLLTPPSVPHAEVALTDYSNYWLNLKVSGSPDWPRFCFDDREHSIYVLRQVMTLILFLSLTTDYFPLSTLPQNRPRLYDIWKRLRANGFYRNARKFAWW